MALTHPHRSPLRQGARQVALLVLTALAASILWATGAAAAHAATGYRYWNYFHVKAGSYAFATTGPAGYVPQDGSVEAYRYGLSGGAKGLTPRSPADRYSVTDICAGTTAGSGQKRVGVLVDYGSPADAPSGQTPPKPRAACAVVPAAANGQQVLDAVSDLRLDKQLVCGIDGYPASGCSVTVKNAPKPATEQQVSFTLPAKAGSSTAADDATATKAASSSKVQSDSGTSWTLVVVVAVVVVLAGAGLLLARRRRDA
jgi:hypothetical protein